MFLALSAFFHFLVASPWGFPKYREELLDTRNRFRWVEYSTSSTVMVVLIAVIVGMTDVVALLGIAGANASMIFFGWLMEVFANVLLAERVAQLSPSLLGTPVAPGATATTRTEFQMADAPCGT